MGKQIRLSSWSLCLFWKTVEKTSAILDGLYVAEQMRGREEFTSKRNSLIVHHYLCGCIAIDWEWFTDTIIIL